MSSKNKIYLTLSLILFSSLALIGQYNIDSNQNSIRSNIKQSGSRYPFTVAIDSNPTFIDPVDCWDIPSMRVLVQSIEPLVGYNLSDPNYNIIPMLAESWKWHGVDEISFKLREGVFFHDGTPFNADAVIWNLDRLTWFCNYTGTLVENGTSWLAFPTSLYFFPDGITPIISNYFKNSLYNITIRLTRPYSPFLDLLTFIASHIISPSSSPKYSYLQMPTDVVVGTGPFVMDGPVVIDHEVRYYAYENYWQGKANIDVLVFDIIEDDVLRTDGFIAGNYQFLFRPMRENFSDIIADPLLVLSNADEFCQLYFEFYCGDLIHPGLNVTWRKALQHAINYSHIIDEIYQGQVVRSAALLARKMPGYNSSVTIVDMDIPLARSIMQSMGFGVGWDTSYPGIDEAQWTAANFRTIEVNRHYGHTNNQKMNELLSQNFDLIGVTTLETIRTWGEYLETGENHPWDMEISYIGWCPDFLDAYDMIYHLLHNESQNNFAHVNDPYLESLLDLLLQIPNATIRQLIYKHIQSYLFDVNTPDHKWKYPHAPLFNAEIYYAYHINLTGFRPDPLGIVYFYQCDWPFKPPSSCELTSNADIPDIDGIFDLTWYASDADNYSVYEYDKFINAINGSLTSLASEITALSIPRIGYKTGSYYFIVVAHNKFGDRLSNCIKIVVSLPLPGPFTLSSNADTPDTDGTFDLVWTSSSDANNYSVYRSDNPISVIDGSLTLLSYQVATSPFPVSGLTDGEYYFVVVAHNKEGDTLSNNVHITVQHPEEPSEEIPGYKIIVLLGIALGITAILIKKKKNKI